MRIVILGANGQLGNPVLKRLLRDHPQAQVMGCVREESIATVKEDSELFQHLYVFNPFKDDWRKLGHVDVLINCIGIIRETSTLEFVQAHVGLTELILQHRKIIGSPKILQLSALGADIDSPSRFLSTKGLADAELLQKSDTVIVRPSIVCTPDTMLSKKLQMLKRLCLFSLGLLPFPEQMLETKLQPVMADDLAELISLLCSQHDHATIIEIGGRDIYTLRQLLEMVPNCRRIIPVSQNFSDFLLPLIADIFPALLDKEQLTLLCHDNVVDTLKCERLLGKQMASTAEFWRKELL